MPIRLNLLAEAQAAEEQRRRDPVKRAIWVAALLTVLMLVWSGSLQLKAFIAKVELGRVQAKMNSYTNEHQQVVDNRKALNEIRDRLTALHQLTTNRFLNGTLLNALQHTTVEDVQLVHLRAAQTYTYTDETKPRTNANRVLPGKPPTITEKIVVTLDGSDSSPNPGDLVSKFKEAIASNPYFVKMLTSTNQVYLNNYSQPQLNPATGKPSVQFTLECRYPEKTR